MVLSIDATQDARSQAGFIRPIILVTLTVTQPSTTVYRFSTGYRTYGGNEYLDFLMGVSGIMQTMVHVGNPPIADAVTIRLLNGPYGTSPATLLDALLAATIENATVKIEELLLSPSESRSVPSSTGAVTRFLGRVKRIAKIEDQDFAIECLDERVALDDSIAWYTVAEGDGAPPSEVNKRLPRPYGNDVLVPCVGFDLGASTTLAVDVTESTTGNVKFTDVTLFPTGTNNILLGSEKITYNGKNDANQTLNITVRGVSGGGAAVIHKVGETVIELQANHYWIAADGANLKSVNRIYFKSPSTGQLVDITGVSGVSSDLANTTLVSGRTVASIKLTSAALETLKSLDNVTQQPSTGGVRDFPFNESSSEYNDSRGSLHTEFSAFWNGIPNPLGLPVLRYEASTTGGDDALHRWTVLAADDKVEVTRFRVGIIIRRDNTTTPAYNTTVNAEVKGPSGEVARATVSYTNLSSETAEKNDQSAWTTVSNQPKTLNDFVNAAKTTSENVLNIYTTSPGSSCPSTLIYTFLALRIDFDTVGLLQDAAAFAGGFGLEIFAQVDGYKVPTSDTTYSVSAGTLIEKDHDIARHILQVAAGQSSATLESAWNTQGAIETTNTQHAFDLRTLGSKLSEVLGALGNESRANLPFEAGLWRFLRRPTAGYTPVTGLTFSKTNTLGSFDPSIKGLDDLYNTCAGWYNLDPGIDGGEDSQFKGRVTAVNAAAVTAYGKREITPYRFRTILLSTVAQATLDELLAELKDRRYTLGWSAPYYEHFKLQLGDVVLVQLPFLASTIGVRILEIVRNVQDGSATIKGVQVITA